MAVWSRQAFRGFIEHMREDRPTRDETLAHVNRLAGLATGWRDRTIEAMGQARRLGATDEQLAKASGLSVAAVRALLQRGPRRHSSDQRPR